MSERALDRPSSDPQYGAPSSEVPSKSPGDNCNAKVTDNTGKFIRYCDEPAGEGTDDDYGRCANHGGLSTGAKDAEVLNGSRENNEKHALTSDPKHYHQYLENPEDRDFVLTVSRAVLERISENTGGTDFLDRVLARRVAVMLHISVQASEHVGEEGMFERIMTPDGTIEVENRMLEHFRQYNKDLVRILKDIGATKETEADLDALAVWRNDLGGT